MRAYFFALFGLFLIVCASAWWWLHPQSPLPVPELPMLAHRGESLIVRNNSELQRRLKVDFARSQALPHRIDLPAQFNAPDEQNFPIRSPIAGRIASLKVDEGQIVQKGAVLATLYSGDMAQARADYDKAQAALRFAQQSYKRASAVLVVGGNAVKDQQSARNDLEQAEAENARAKRRLQALRNIDKVSGMMPSELSAPASSPGFSAKPDSEKGILLITAPRDGLITSINVGVGQQITDTNTILMSLANTHYLWLQASMPQDMLPQLRENMILQAQANGKTCSGPITYPDPMIRPETRRLNLYLRCENNDGKFYPGQFVTATLDVPEQREIILPKTALLMDNDAVSVFVETAPNTYTRRYISISYDEGDTVRVLSGITEGTRIITSGAILLNDY